MSVLPALTIGLSCLVFALANTCFPSCLRPSLQLAGFEEWKWRNIVVSLAHSLISGLCALYITRDYVAESVALPMVADGALSRQLLCVSIGYFVYDSLLSLSRIRTFPGRGEIIVHHLITMATLGLSLLDQPLLRSLMPYCVFGLVIELNNVFIHIRSLMDLAHPPTRAHKVTISYKLNSVCALVSVFVFRFLPLLWISNDVLAMMQSTPLSLQVVVHLPIFAIILISGVICYRILQEDFLSCAPANKAE